MALFYTHCLQGFPRLTVNNVVRLLNMSEPVVSSKQSISTYNNNPEGTRLASMSELHVRVLDSSHGLSARPHTPRLGSPVLYPPILIPEYDKEITYRDLKSLIENSKDLLLVDVRSKDEVDKGHIPGSIHIPVNDVEKEFSLDPQAFQEKFGVPKPPLEARNLVFHCQLGRRGGAATDAARTLGFFNARNFTGGYKEWLEKEGK